MGLLNNVLEKMNVKKKEEYSLEEQRAITDVCLATIALSTYAAAIDGEVTLEEYMESDLNTAAINKQFRLPNELSHTIKELSMKHSITWDEVKDYLDVLSIDTLKSLRSSIESVINASDGVNESEKAVLDQFDEYVKGRG